MTTDPFEQGLKLEALKRDVQRLHAAHDPGLASDGLRPSLTKAQRQKKRKARRASRKARRI